MLTLLHIVAGAALTLPAEVRVRGTELTLGQVASVRCADEALRRKVEGFGLGWSPAPGYSRLVTGAQLERELEAAIPGLDVEVAPAATCRVLPETRRVEGRELETRAHTELSALFQAQDARITSKAALRDLELPAERETFELRARLDQRELRAGDWQVPVQVWIDGSLYQTVWTGFAVELWTEAPVLVRDVARGELLAPEFVERRRVQVQPGVPVQGLDGAALAGALALRDLGRGASITARDVRRAQLVAQGEPVTLEVKKGAVVARSTVVCRQDGALGDRVKIQTGDKSRELVAQVVGRALVRIEL